MKNWTKQFKEEKCNTGLASVWRKQPHCNLREIKKIVKDRCDTTRQNILAKMSEKSYLTQHQEVSFCWGTNHTQNVRGNKESGIAWLLAGLWKLIRIRKNTDEICPLCLGERDAEHILLGLSLNYTMVKFLNEK